MGFNQHSPKRDVGPLHAVKGRLRGAHGSSFQMGHKEIVCVERRSADIDASTVSQSVSCLLRRRHRMIRDADGVFERLERTRSSQRCLRMRVIVIARATSVIVQGPLE
jgi:hypothetical protein